MSSCVSNGFAPIGTSDVRRDTPFRLEFTLEIFSSQRGLFFIWRADEGLTILRFVSALVIEQSIPGSFQTAPDVSRDDRNARRMTGSAMAYGCIPVGIAATMRSSIIPLPPIGFMTGNWAGSTELAAVLNENTLN